MSSPLEAQRPVALFANGIGDTILSLPALRALAALFPHRLSLICNRGAYRLCLSEISICGVVEPWKEDADGSREFRLTEVADATSGCDLFLSLVPWHSKSVKALLEILSPKLTIGFFPDFDIVLPRDYSKHSADLTFDLPKHLEPSLVLEDYAAPPQFPLQAQREARQLLAPIPPSLRLLAIHTDTLREKMWAHDRFVAVLDIFLERHSDFLVLAVGSIHQPLDTGRHGDRVIPCYGLTLPVSCCLVNQADLFLGVDSCMLHVADLCRVPGVGLFGPTSSDEFGFRFTQHRHVCANRAMDAISVDAVIEALESLMPENTSSCASWGRDSGAARRRFRGDFSPSSGGAGEMRES